MCTNQSATHAQFSNTFIPVDDKDHYTETSNNHEALCQNQGAHKIKQKEKYQEELSINQGMNTVKTEYSSIKTTTADIPDIIDIKEKNYNTQNDKIDSNFDIKPEYRKVKQD